MFVLYDFQGLMEINTAIAANLHSLPHNLLHVAYRGEINAGVSLSTASEKERKQ